MPSNGRPALLDLGLAIAMPVLCGLAWMTWAGAPRSYLAVNIAALLIAIATALWLPMPNRASRHLVFASGTLLLLWLTALFGKEIAGVRRWVELGPLSLHIGYLVLPLFVVMTSRLPGKTAAALLFLAAIATTVQPDRAATYALAAAAAAIALQRKDRYAVSALVVTLLATAFVPMLADPLQPVRFVEGVQRDALAREPALGALLVLATLAPLALLRSGGGHAFPLAMFMVVAGYAAFIGAYPSILIGYGAAPILGFGLAISALRKQ